MTVSSEDLDVDTRSFYFGGRDKPAMYVALRPGGHPRLAEISALTIAVAQTFGLPPLEVGGDGVTSIPRAADGWGATLMFDGGQAPLLSIDWPVAPMPLVYGVRKTSPSRWAADAIEAGGLVLLVGPALDWDMITVPLEAGGELAVARMGALMAAIGGREVACGIVPVTSR